MYYDVQDVKWLLYQNNGITVHSEGGEPFRRASQYGHLDVLKYLLQTQDDAERFVQPHTMAALTSTSIFLGRLFHQTIMWLARGGHLDCIKFLADITSVTTI